MTIEQRNSYQDTNRIKIPNLSKYHLAALEGYVDMLCDASKREANQGSDQHKGLTPTHLAAQSGHLEALRILVGRGGEPEKCSYDGSNALHLAASNNHLNCVSFLVNFGVNKWTLDNELRTPRDVAASRHRKEVLDYLDQMMAKQSALDTKNVQKLKEKAKVGAEKRLKQMRKAQLKAIKQMERDERQLIKLSNSRQLLKSAHSISDIKLVGRPDCAINYSPLNASRASLVAAYGLPSSKQFRVPFGPTQGTQNRLNTDLMSAARLNFRSAKLGTSIRSDESAYSGSSIVSSTSGYLSNASSTSGPSASGPELRRPKYSDLVSISNQLAKVSPRACNASQTKLTNNEQQSLKSNSTIGVKLRGVSRKVQLKRLLQANNSQPEARSASQTGSLADNVKPKQSPIEEPKAESGLNQIRWPPAPCLVRARSEPDFLSSIENRSAEAHSESANEAAQADESGHNLLKVSSQTNDNKESQHHQLLHQCLSQLKLHHEAKYNNSNSKSIVGYSDELLQHKLNAGKLPLRPSIIKAHNLNQGEQAAELLRSKTTNISIDSIGSAGSLVERNQCTSSKSSFVNEFSGEPMNEPSEKLKSPKPIVGSSKSFVDEPRLGLSNLVTSIDSFLMSSGLPDLGQVFAKERIDLEALMLLSEQDLKSLNILLGPRRKLLKAIEERRRKLRGNKQLICLDSIGVNCVMLDTQL